MNTLDKQYTDLLQDILDNGVTKQDRTGTGTISVFGRQIRHKMSEGFPLLTTKKMPFKTIVTELLWFLRGDTNIKFLVDNNCHIWDGDAYQAYLKEYEKDTSIGGNVYYTDPLTYKPYFQHEFIDKIKTNTEFAMNWGDLGPVYGKQWRGWGRKNVTNYDLKDVKGSNQPKVLEAIKNGGDVTKYGVKIEYQNNSIDQIANLIDDLKKNPDSRRLMVNSWNVGELDQMTLPPCHYGFQVYTRELSNEEIAFEANKRGFNLKGMTISGKLLIDPKEVKEKNLPTRAISLMWNQRSVDSFLGLPFNIASYGLLLEIIAAATNMVPDELIGNLGDTHLYLNHVEQAKEQIGRELSKEERIELAFKSIESTDGNSAALLWELSCQGKNESEIIESLNNSPRNIPTRTREPYPLPKLIIDQFDETNHYIGDIDDISEYNIEQFKLENYQPHPAIKAPLSN